MLEHRNRLSPYCSKISRSRYHRMFNVPSDVSRHYDTLLYRSSAAPRFGGTESLARVGLADRAVMIVQSGQFSHVCFWPVADRRPVPKPGVRKLYTTPASMTPRTSAYGRVQTLAAAADRYFIKNHDVRIKSPNRIFGLCLFPTHFGPLNNRSAQSKIPRSRHTAPTDKPAEASHLDAHASFLF